MVSRLSEKFVLHVMKFVGAELETTRHIGFYAKWSHFIMMHHGLWIKRKWKDLLPTLNQLQKVLNNKVNELSEICDRNEQTVDFLLTMSKLRKLKSNEQENKEEDHEEKEDEEMDYEVNDDEDSANAFQAKWSDED